MLRATFIGHQGWLLSSEDTNVLIDPLLTDRFGHGGLAGRVFPPRRFDFDRMPRIDAVWLTHEHDDHVCFPSLRRLDRAVPIYISGRSSIALSGALEELGFTVRRVGAGVTVEVGSLQFRTFAGDHRATPHADEWDVLPFLATDAAGDGAFASSVDVDTPDALLDAVASASVRQWMLCIANNTTDVRFVQDGAGRIAPTDDTDALARVLTRRWQSAAGRAGAPCFTAITGGGWSHPADVSWIDSVAFCIDPKRLAHALGEACSAPASAVRPGEGFAMTGGELQSVQSDWIASESTTRPLAEPVDVPNDFEPACGLRQLDDDGWSSLEAGLRELARFLYGREFFVAAHSVASVDSFLGLFLHDDGGDRTYAWSPPAGTFVRSKDVAFQCRLRLWATDLHGLFEGRLGPSALCYTGRLRCTNRAPRVLRVSPQLLWMFAHPLHRPDVARRLYDASAPEALP